VGVIRKIKMVRNWFGRQSSSCFAYVDVLVKRVGYAVDDISGDACKVVDWVRAKMAANFKLNRSTSDSWKSSFRSLHAKKKVSSVSK